MIVNIQQKYDELSPAQKDIFAGYGLRQVKHFVEISLPTIEAALLLIPWFRESMPRVKFRLCILIPCKLISGFQIKSGKKLLMFQCL